MPRIPKRWLQAAVFVYPNKASAKSDLTGGGTGFFVARQVDGGWQSFVVTNRHVIDKLDNPVIRLNQLGTAEPDIWVTNRSRWFDHPSGDDLSVYPLDMEVDIHRHVFFWEHAFYPIDDRHVGLGSEVVMIGRFVGLNRQPEIMPMARFGCIANPEVFRETNSFGKPQETIVVECHSVPGFSGSPVLAYIPSNATSEDALENSGVGPFLLGVVWKHFGNPEEVLDEKLSPIGAQIKGNSGFAGVIPALKISEILQNIPEAASYLFPSEP